MHYSKFACSHRHWTFEERRELERRWNESLRFPKKSRLSTNAFADKYGIPRATVALEIKRGTLGRSFYDSIRKEWFHCRPSDLFDPPMSPFRAPRTQNLPDSRQRPRTWKNGKDGQLRPGMGTPTTGTTPGLLSAISISSLSYFSPGEHSPVRRSFAILLPMPQNFSM